MKNFLIQTWAIIGYIVGLIGTFVTIFTVSGSLTIKISWLIFGGIVFVSSIIFAISAIVRLMKTIKNGIRHKIIAHSFDTEIGDIYYTDYSDCLRIDTVVTFYHTKPRSKKIGYGIVRNAVNGEYVEVYVIHVEKQALETFNQLKTNDKKVLDNMYILPNTYIDSLQTLVDIINGGKK